MENYNELFSEKTIDEINEILTNVRKAATESKKEIRKAEKARIKAEKAVKAAEKAEKVKKYLLTVENGEMLIALVKGEKVEVEFVKLNEKTFTAVVNGAKRGIRFDKLVMDSDSE